MDIALAGAIEKREPIFNTKHPDYNNRPLVQALWEEISVELDISVIRCKEKWKVLRSNYSRHVKACLQRQRTGEVKTRKDWHMVEHLQFLEPHVKIRKVSKSMPDSNKNSDDEFKEFEELYADSMKEKPLQNGVVKLKEENTQGWEEFSSSSKEMVNGNISNEDNTMDSDSFPGSDHSKLANGFEGFDEESNIVKKSKPKIQKVKSCKKSKKKNNDKISNTASQPKQKSDHSWMNGERPSNSLENLFPGNEGSTPFKEDLDMDNNELFLMNLAPAMKMLSDEDNYVFRVEAEQLLFKKIFHS